VDVLTAVDMLQPLVDVGSMTADCTELDGHSRRTAQCRHDNSRIFEVFNACTEMINGLVRDEIELRTSIDV
jgi:hypothetical protein